MQIDPSIFSIGQEFAKTIQALAIVESGIVSTKEGDDGQAFGILQQHPDFFVQWYAQAADRTNTDTWPAAQIKAVREFLKHYAALNWTIEACVQAYNEGVGNWEKGVPDPAYLAKFQAAYASLSA